ncbi:TPA: restriction endonuclease subunit S [Klebsiella quasipneumoniae]|nr:MULTISPECIES: restriction endonuclease subunit S [Klebsiella]KMH46523.1 hypothetical protein SM73_04666 [Klebsiella quasipneumoniae]MBC4258635.1 restriction endonuclease subunit S [Klebsiella pneumoniae]MDK7807017.1 restriction endonuclease subunit S [Klebsiella pneumoniae]HBT0517519.1 restriction endonuclease subunit S [Klebsiella pneumoniae]HBT0522920.1 restriction endonuclease subunit S [Klebsiella pneumoniae]
MSKTMLPKEWINTNLGAILLSIIGGGTPSKSKPEYFLGNIPWMSVKDMNKHILKDTVDHITPDAVKNSSTNIIPAGTPIIATRMSLGKIVTASFDSAINQDLKALFLPKDIERNFFLHWYRSQSQLIESLGTGTTVKGIRLEVLNGLSINLPPLAEQKIIADKLDDLLARVESIKTRLENIPEILKKFRQSVLNSVVKGALPSSFYESDHKNKKTFKEIGVTIKTGPFGSALHKDDYIVGGIPVINPMHIKDGFIYPSDSMTISNEKFLELSSWALEHNDIIVGRRGEMGRAAVIHESSKKMLCGTGSLILRGNEKILPKYLELIIRSPDAIDYFSRESVGTTMINLNQKIINGFSVNLPPIEKQRDIVNYIENFYHYSTMIEKMTGNALSKINNLTQSILAKAFRGELTAQWREENPELISGLNSAEALLEKITTEKLAAGTIKKRAKKFSH